MLEIPNCVITQSMKKKLQYTSENNHIYVKITKMATFLSYQKRVQVFLIALFIFPFHLTSLSLPFFTSLNLPPFHNFLLSHFVTYLFFFFVKNYL